MNCTPKSKPHSTTSHKDTQEKKQKQRQQTPTKKRKKVVSSSNESSDTDDAYDSPASHVSTRSSVRKSEEEEAKIGKSTKLTKTVKVKTKKKSKLVLGLYECKVCNWRNDDGDKFVDHCLITHSTRMSICRIPGCTKSYSSQNGLRNHCKTVHGEVLQCDVCKVVSLSPESVAAHKASHTSKHQCDGCKKSFTRSNDRDKHWRYTCPKNPERYIKCKHCLHASGGDEKKAEVPGAEAGLMNHLIDFHKLQGEHLCAYCHRLLSSLKKLTTHNEKCTKTNPNPPLEPM